MRLVWMNGGLGNQVFQYIFMRYIEEKTGEECIIDDMFFFNYTEAEKNNPAHNGFQIDRIFPVKPKRLSNILEPDVFDELRKLSAECLQPSGLPRGLVPVFRELGTDLSVICEANLFVERFAPCKCRKYSTAINQYNPEVLDVKGDIYYYGYWINAQWFASIGLTMLKELTFPDIPDEKNRKYLDAIRAAGKNSVAIHVRRGDFVTLGWNIDPALYAQMVTAIRKDIGSPEFFIFSDDLAWVKDNLKEIGLSPEDKLVFIEGNERETSYIDMQLMKECRGMVFPNSSFSYLAALLNTRTDKIAYQPTNRQIIYYENSSEQH